MQQRWSIWDFIKGNEREDVAPPKQELIKSPPPKRDIHRRVIATHIMADMFARWMRSEGATGYWLADEIDELREAFCDRFGYTVPCPYEFRSYLAHTPGCSKGVHRLKGWEFQEVSRRTTMERPTLYKIEPELAAPRPVAIKTRIVLKDGKAKK